MTGALKELAAGRKVVFVFHAGSGDRAQLVAHAVDISELFPGSDLIDTQSTRHSQIKLERILEYMGVDYTSLHNGSNDARFTLEAALVMIMFKNEQSSSFRSGDRLTPLLKSWKLRSAPCKAAKVAQNAACAVKSGSTPLEALVNGKPLGMSQNEWKHRKANGEC